MNFILLTKLGGFDVALDPKWIWRVEEFGKNQLREAFTRVYVEIPKDPDAVAYDVMQSAQVVLEGIKEYEKVSVRP